MKSTKWYKLARGIEAKRCKTHEAKRRSGCTAKFQNPWSKPRCLVPKDQCGSVLDRSYILMHATCYLERLGNFHVAHF